MPKNKGKGGKNRRRGKNENDNEKRELTFKEEGQGMSLSPLSLSLSLSLSISVSLSLARDGRRQRWCLFSPQQSANQILSLPEYAQVLKMLGNGRLEAYCFDGSKRLAHIRGKLRKKVWINQGDIILLSLRDYQDEKGDVILKYSADEARSLKAYGELPDSAKINETDTYGGDEEGGIGFDFGEDDDSESGDDVDIDDI
jgi:translation initiation factor 1A